MARTDTRAILRGFAQPPEWLRVARWGIAGAWRAPGGWALRSWTWSGKGATRQLIDRQLHGTFGELAGAARAGRALTRSSSRRGSTTKDNPNPRIKAPRSPGWWVNAERCLGCGARYKDHRSPIDFAEAANELRLRAKAEGDDTGGFRSRGPVLWVMRTRKLGDWYAEHRYCEAAARARRPAELEARANPGKGAFGAALKARKAWTDAPARGVVRGRDTAVEAAPGGLLVDLGELVAVEYRETKLRDGPRAGVYRHEFGEEGGTRPRLTADGHARLRVLGGSYVIAPEGIRD